MTRDTFKAKDTTIESSDSVALRARLLEMADRIESAVQFPAVTAPLLYQWATDIRALSLPASEAVAWYSPTVNRAWVKWQNAHDYFMARVPSHNFADWIQKELVPLYTHPSPMPVDALRELATQLASDAECKGLSTGYRSACGHIHNQLTALLSGGAAREGA